jgi:hypothetical protein
MTESTTRRGPWVWPKFTTANMKQSVSAILWTLADLGGSIEDKSGRCSSKLIDACEKAGTPLHPTNKPATTFQSLDSGSHSPMLAGCIARDTIQKRTYKITLLLKPDEMPPRPKRIVSDGGTGPRPVPVPEPEQPKPAPEPESEAVEPTIPPLVAVGIHDELDLALHATDTLAKLVTEILMRRAMPATDAQPDNDEQAIRLAQTIEENNRLRAKVNDQAETIRAKTKETEGLRRALMVSENNLKTLRETVAGSTDRERNLSRLNGNQRFIAQKPEPAILRRAK